MEALLNNLPEIIITLAIVGSFAAVLWKALDGYEAMAKQLGKTIDTLQANKDQSDFLRQNFDNAPEQRKKIVRLALDGLDTVTDWTGTPDDDDIAERFRALLGIGESEAGKSDNATP